MPGMLVTVLFSILLTSAVALGSGANPPASSEQGEQAPDTVGDGCAILTPQRAANTFGVDADHLRQRQRTDGCSYKLRKRTDEMLEAKISMLQVHGSEEAAAEWLARVTVRVTKAEADRAAPAFASVIGKEGLRYQDLPGLADEARISMRDASIWARVENLTFVVGAYKGLRPTATESYQDWEKKTFEKRKKDTQKLAETILTALAQARESKR